MWIESKQLKRLDIVFLKSEEKLLIKLVFYITIIVILNLRS